MPDLKERLLECIDRLRAGTLTEADLRAALDEVDLPARQSLLYIETANTHPGSTALGMMLILNGNCVEPPADPSEWPYRSVLDAMNDGWRVISFPNLALLMDPVTPAGLGCEFILEKWNP